MYASDLVELFLEVTGVQRHDLQTAGDCAQLCALICWKAGQPLMALARSKVMAITHTEARRLVAMAKKRVEREPVFAERVGTIGQWMAERALYLEQLKTRAKKKGGARAGAGRPSRADRDRASSQVEQ